MRSNGLSHTNAGFVKNLFTHLLDDDCYGMSFQSPTKEFYEEVIERECVVPNPTGELVLVRQFWLILNLYNLIECIFIVSAKSGKKKKRNRRQNELSEKARAALANFPISSKPEKLSLEALAASALARRTSLEDRVKRCRSEAGFLF